jgi:hypothetical protein
MVDEALFEWDEAKSTKTCASEDSASITHLRFSLVTCWRRKTGDTTTVNTVSSLLAGSMKSCWS